MLPTYREADEAQLAAVRTAVVAELTDLETVLKRVPLERFQSTTLGQLRGLDAFTYLPVRDAATALCDQGRFEEALPLALYLAMHEPQHPPFAFLAASCLQRVGLFAEAAALYATTVSDGANDPIAFFRIGECQESLRHRSEAGAAFEAALDASRGRPDLWQLQDWAMSHLQALKTAQENAHA